MPTVGNSVIQLSQGVAQSWAVFAAKSFQTVDPHRGVNLISDALPFGRLWYGEPNAVANAISYAKSYSRSHSVVIRVYDAADNVIETHEHTGEFKEPRALTVAAIMVCPTIAMPN